MSLTLKITEPGVSHVTDLGRYGYAHIGIQTHGAVDQVSARVANILVGNPDAAPVIEAMSIMAMEFETSTTSLVAVTGMAGDVTIDGLSVPLCQPFLTWPGARVRIWPGTVGVRAYVAVHGQIQATAFLGSVARDALTGSGRELARGDLIGVAGSDVTHVPTLPLFRLECPIAAYGHDWRLDILPGLELDEFPDFRPRIESMPLTVGTNSDHIGVRLEGQAFTRSVDKEIVSRGVPLGALEIPPVGGLIVLLRGRPMTAGYPVPAVVARSSHHLLGQLRPGDTVRLRWSSVQESVHSLMRLERKLDDLRRRASSMLDAVGLFPAR